MAILARTVFLRDPKRHRDIILRAGEEPAPEYAALITSPDAWEGGVLPDLASDATSTGDDGDKQEQDSADKEPPVAKKTAASKRAATKPARGREAAEKGDSGD
ncbi:MAG: hypothetical protein HOY75_08575 [Streptomyces sp.]|nr:hypothetical protein [Streptomyces sp.]